MQIRKKYQLKYPKEPLSSQRQLDSINEDKFGDQPIDQKTKIKEIKQQKKLEREQEDLQAQQAADDSLEYFLGATHYLTEIKRSIFAYYFSKKARYFSFIGLQVITLIMTLLLAMLCRSLMSLGYMVLSVPLIMQITDFFHLDKIHQEGRRWKHPYYICGPLMIFSFVDIALQILCQAPLYKGDYLLRQFGFDKVYDINTKITFEEMLYPGDKGYRFISLANDGQSLLFLILKGLNLFFIFLQSRIYSSDAFWEFIRVDLRRLLKLASSYKSMAMTYRYNNWKLQKIVTVQQRKAKMYEGVAELKMKMNHYLRSQQSLVTGRVQTIPATSKNNLRQPLLEKIDEEEQKFDTTINTFTIIDQSTSPGGQQQMLRRKTTTLNGKPLSQKKVELSKQLDASFKFQKFQDLLKQDDDFFEKQEVIEKMKKQVGRCGSWYLCLKKKYVNQIVFINDIGDAKNVKQLMSQGKRKIECDLEKQMRTDIDVIFQQRKNQSSSLEKKVRKRMGIKLEEDEVTISQMPRTQDFLKFSNIALANIGAFLEAIFSNLAMMSYVFMILSQILNAGLISILLPFAVFGYALMEEGRPGKEFWRIIKIYVIIILFLKFTINLDLLYENKDLVTSYTSMNNWVMFGLWREDSTWGLFLYILPELIILACVLGQNYYEILVGLYDKREIDLENIEEARERFLKQFNEEQEAQIKKADRARKVLEEEDVPHEEDPQDAYDERISKFPKKIRKIIDQVESKIFKEHDDVINDNGTIQKLRKELAEDISKGILESGEYYTRRYSLVPDRSERKQLVKTLKQKRPENQGLVRNYFGKHSYFRRLFPKVKEQKPGIDFYGKITFIQFVICVFLISFYTKLDARGTQNLENSSQFSIYMVVMLFVQAFVMILERYISRTNTRVNLQKARNGKKEFTDEVQTKMTLGGSLSMHLQAQKTSDTILFGRSAADAAKGGALDQTKEILSIQLQHTRMTNQQVTKWVIQWVLLILYHALVFWIFPLSSNDAIYGTPYCDTKSNLFAKYGCLSFKQNFYLIAFYMIFCYYFMLSALQIRYGYPDYKEPSSLTSKLGLGPVLTYRVFYVLPFVFELKIILDWCFQKTSLDIFQWLELGEIDSELYFFKNGNRGYFERKIGTRIVRFEKCLCGCFCLGVILFFLIGPFFMFSNLSYIADTNLVTDATLDFSINILNTEKYETYEFPIFSTDNPLSMKQMNDTEFLRREYQKLPETKFFDYDQVQQIVMKNSSDTEWTISSDYRAAFKNLMNQSVHNSSKLFTTLEMSYSFTRPGPAEAPIAYGKHSRTLYYHNENDKKVLEQLHEAMEIDCQKNPDDIKNVTINNFIPFQLRLGEKKDVIDLNLDRENVTLSYSCQNYWALNVNFTGILFIVFSDLISSNLFDATSIMGFYLGVAVLVGQTLRKIVVYNADRIYITEIPNPDPIRNLIRCIYMQRLEQNLKKEEELFFILMEILRSPEMIRAICGSSLRAPLVQPAVLAGNGQLTSQDSFVSSNYSAQNTLKA